MNNLRFNNKAFTFAELMVGLSLTLIIIGFTFSIYVGMQKLFPGGINQVVFQSYGRSSLERIMGDVRSAVSATVNGGATTLTLVTDPNNTYNNSLDDVTISYSVNSGTITYDPDTSVASNESTLVENIDVVTGIPYFQINGDVVVVAFKVTDTDTLLGTQSANFSSTAKMRNIP